MGGMKETYGLTDFSTYEQKVIEGYSSLVNELFCEESCPKSSKNKESIGFETQRFRKEIKHFLDTIIAIFSITHINNAVKEEDGEKAVHCAILQKCITKFRAVYRKYFRGVHYLTSKRLAECKLHAQQNALTTFDSLVKLQVSDDMSAEQNKKNKSILLCRMNIEHEWIEKVNMFKKNKIIFSIKMDVLDGFKNDIEMEFPMLYCGGAGTDFYAEEKLALKYTDKLIKAVDNFKEQIPFEEDEDSLLDLTTEFEKDLKEKVIDPLVRRNSENKRATRMILQAKLDRSVATYKEKMSTYVIKAPVQEPNFFLVRHEMLKKELEPTNLMRREKSNMEDTGFEELQVEYLNIYQELIHQTFVEQLSCGMKKTVDDLSKCHAETDDILKRLSLELQKNFETFKISKEYVNKLMTSINRSTKEIFEEIRDSSIGNNDNIDILVAKSKPLVFLTKAERAKQEIEVSGVLVKMKQLYTDELRSIYTKYYAVSDAQREEVKMAVVKQFKMEIEEKCGHDYYQSCLKHVEALREYADQHWKLNYVNKGLNATAARNPAEPAGSVHAGRRWMPAQQQERYKSLIDRGLQGGDSRIYK